MPLRLLPLLLLLLARPPVAGAQSDTLRAALPAIRIESSRTAETEATAPYTVSVRTRPPEAVALEPAVTLDEVLHTVPGLWVSDRENFSLGERLSVRGSGWRSGFGVRGAQLLLDGIPLTMPDGQAVLTVVDPAFVRRVEVIHGPASTLWGNSSGGVVALSTFPEDPDTPSRLRVLGGSHGLRKVEAEHGARFGAHRVAAYASHLRLDGFRQHGDAVLTRVNAHGAFALSPNSYLRAIAAYLDAPVSDNPGSLTAAQMAADRRQADPRNVAAAAGKATRHGQAGATLYHETPAGLFSATAYGLFRRLDNPLTFAYVMLDRLAGGGRLAFHDPGTYFDWSAGADAGFQRDDRQNWGNVGGEPADTVRLDQVERVLNTAVFAHGALRATPRLTLSAGLRFDRLGFGATDRLLSNGDESGTRAFSAWSPSAGITFAASAATLYAHLSTAFEAPTTTELVNRPDLAGGFNPELDPQRTFHVEGGVRGRFPTARLEYLLALFSLDTSGLLLPFETPGGAGRTFYRNAGETRHEGAEVYLGWQPFETLRASAGYAWSYFRFTEPELQETLPVGNRIPGLPAHRLTAAVEGVTGGVRVALHAEAVDGMYVDDLNTARTDPYFVLNLSLGHAGLRLAPGLAAQPFVRVSNLLDRRYVGSVVINAAGGRYYEPSAGRQWQAGVGVSF